MEHYYTEKSTTEQVKKTIRHVILDKEMCFITSNAVFSKDAVDFGSHFLIETVLEHSPSIGKTLDIGCGYGAIGVTLAVFSPDATVTMVDVNERAVNLANENASLNGVFGRAKAQVSDICEQVEGLYDTVVTNPPIRAGKNVVHAIYEQAFEHLSPGGKLFVVIQKKQGAPSSMDKMKQLFGNCEMIARKAGYHILLSIK
ncbi:MULTISPECIES: class I SAM-dependent methyltransferase [unclassified Fusibacter]|uniref:class I SAM-dependent methyltransferase n=1 Tax=unclassified Fusibacter TaxID=2624464 RepID=UPI001012FA48|nr:MULTISPECIES: class I SAM-dependent methyltransferase [unclassified Fusibacter]MCK8061555.1 class I SAM-dependent methyltransferase [Fusibacter sp. A2]NPE23717.1 class I SAM-dependent methyltransferase [Fusibacter sp. A1]RXV58744.1 class I SAM-dependent methyltransferase [Fusibacter sp. A1]